MNKKDSNKLKVLDLLDKFKGSRVKTATALGISTRTMSNYIDELRKDGHDIMCGKKASLIRIKSAGTKLIATNEERLKHADRMLNADFLHG